MGRTSSSSAPKVAKRVVKTIAATAGNVVRNLSPGAGKRWLVLHGIVTLVTGIAVANRNLVTHLTDGTNITGSLLRASADTTASSTSRIVYTSSGGGQTVTAQESLILAINGHIPAQGIILEGADQFRITCVNGDAGDSFSGQLVVLEEDI